jgi:hypothetical protein
MKKLYPSTATPIEAPIMVISSIERSLTLRAQLTAEHNTIKEKMHAVAQHEMTMTSSQRY